MKKRIFFLLTLIGFSQTLLAETSEYLEIVEYRVASIVNDSTVPNDRALIRVSVVNTDFEKGDVILYGNEAFSLEATLDKNAEFEFMLDAGIVELQFFPKNRTGFAEIITVPLHMQGGAITTLIIHFFEQAEIIQSIKKPVIYLYPTEPQEISVQLQTKGDLTFTYPDYDNGWNFTATPSGDLHFADETYSYLFWEAEMELTDAHYFMDEGKRVNREELLEYIESSLDQFGFNSKEKADFITFWVPQMLRYEHTQIHFVFNESCDQFAELSISPQPDQILRFYMIWSPIDALNSSDVPLSPQQFPLKNPRDGFTVLEWGGAEMQLKSTLLTLESQ